ncbi:hypothetical protein NDU88_004911 [Pleurodeles waltl]|uniref:Secreted protein n=1 Tax=Pleurodeles waltl TaxID=8319 RepID=A0AAV7MUS5_PLEWA|nr:hypothetical protein NDU88_004911 [Pleurodeles waltl]
MACAVLGAECLLLHVRDANAWLFRARGAHVWSGRSGGPPLRGNHGVSRLGGRVSTRARLHRFAWLSRTRRGEGNALSKNCRASSDKEPPQMGAHRLLGTHHCRIAPGA